MSSPSPPINNDDAENGIEDNIVMTSQEQTAELSEPQFQTAKDAEEATDDDDIQKPPAWYQFEGYKVAEGYHLTGIARGALVMSNIFLSTAIVYLAEDQAGCLDEDGESIDDCDGQVYGFKPASFVTNIAVVAGVLSAIFMPFIGAMVDCTDHRKTVGIVSAVTILLIQAAQIGTVADTWFVMTCLQAVAGFLYQVQVLAVYAYLPDMSYIIGETKMTHYSSIFVMSQFTSQFSFLGFVILLSLAFGISENDVATAQMSQGVNFIWSGLFFFLGWRALPTAKPRRILEEGRSLFVEGFSKVFRTAININRNYKKGTRWFFLCLIVAEAAANAFTVVAVIFLREHVGLSGFEIGIFFFITLVGSIPGSIVGRRVTSALDPKRSWRLCMVAMTIWTSAGAFVLALVPIYAAYVWGFGVGMTLGWFYPVENVFFAMCLPKGQESELAGFFVYCTQILGWLPPLVFSLMVEADVSQSYGVVVVTLFFPLAIGILSMAAPWEEILEDAGRSALPDSEDKEAQTSEPAKETAKECAGSLSAGEDEQV